mgnify:CR=1 FL=1
MVSGTPYTVARQRSLRSGSCSANHATSAFGMAPDKSANPLDSKIRELAIMRVGFTQASKFVYSQHCKAARRFKITEAQIAAIAKIQLKRLEQRLAAQDMKLDVSDSALAEIAKVATVLFVAALAVQWRRRKIDTGMTGAMTAGGNRRRWRCRPRRSAVDRSCADRAPERVHGVR